MNTVTRRLPLLLLVTMSLTLALPATAQDRGGDRGNDRRGDWRERWENMSEEEREALRERMEERRAEMEKRRSEQMREQLGMNEEEFELINPMIEKVRTLMREREMAGRGGGQGRAGRRGGFGGGGGDAEQDQSPEVKAATEAMASLRQAIEDEDKGDIKAALAKLRKARAAMDAKVKTAREELRGVCTPQWEAELVVMGVLD